MQNGKEKQQFYYPHTQKGHPYALENASGLGDRIF